MDNDAMTAVWDMESLVGTAQPTARSAADVLPWIRPTLAHVNYSELDFCTLASQLGVQSAAEILLLMVARRNTTPQDTQAVQHLGIPWKTKSWTGIGKLQKVSLACITAPFLPRQIACPILSSM